MLLLALVARAGFALDALALVRPVCPMGADFAQALRAGRADCWIATRAGAQAARLDFCRPYPGRAMARALRQLSSCEATAAALRAPHSGRAIFG